MDAGRRVFQEGAVALRGREIVAVGSTAEIMAAYQAAEVVDCRGHAIMPGLVNTHTHLPMSLLRGLADDLRLDVWLYGYILPVEREYVNPEFCFLGTTLSCAEMLRGGTTCFADMYYHEQEVAWAAVQAGMRGICGETVIKFPTPDAANYDDSLRYCRDFIEQWRGHELIVAAPAPHSVYMTTPDILARTTELAQAYDVPQLIHVAETAEEVESWVSATTMRPVRWLEAGGYLASKVVAAHCVHVNTEEMEVLRRHNVGVAHNPTSNLKLSSGIAPVAEMLARGLNVGVGTDGSASNNDLDMFEETRLAAMLPKVVTGDPTAVPAEEAVAMATIYGARALHWITSSARWRWASGRRHCGAPGQRAFGAPLRYHRPQCLLADRLHRQGRGRARRVRQRARRGARRGSAHGERGGGDCPGPGAGRAGQSLFRQPRKERAGQAGGHRRPAARRDL
jgi:5-methylthioadenosine/S-adenosylhomocysteine deaminase